MRRFIVIALAAVLSAGMVGLVEAKKPAKERTFYLHFPSDGGTCGTSFMDLDKDLKDSGCGYTAQPANELLYAAGDPLSRDWPAADGVPFKLDTSQPLTAKLALNSLFGTAAIGQGIVELKVSGSIGGDFVTLAEDTVELIMGPPGSNVAEFEIELPKKLNGKKVTSLSATTLVRGVNNFHYFDLERDPAHIVIPTK